MFFSILFYGLLSIPMFALSYYSVSGLYGFLANSVIVLALLFILFIAVCTNSRTMCIFMFISNVCFLNISNWIIVGQDNIYMFLINICTQVLFYCVAFNVSPGIGNKIYFIFVLGLIVLSYYFGVLPNSADSYLYIIYPNMFYVGLSIIITNLKVYNLNQLEYNI